MQLEYLETLVEAASLGSFSRAAQSLCLTQSAVSKRIRCLEEHYGYPLLDRSGPSVVPTPAGELVIGKARHLIAIERELAHGLEGLNRRRPVTFCCTPGFGIAHLPEVMRRLVLRETDLSRVRFLFDAPESILKGIAEERYDVAVVEHCTAPDFEGLRTFPLRSDEMVFVSAPSLQLAGPVLAPEDLCAQTLLHRQETCCSRIFLDGNLRNIGRGIGDFRRAVLIDDLHLILESAVGGEGIAFVSRDVVAAQLRDGQLVTHRVEGFTHRRERTLVATSRASAREVDDRLIEAIRDVCSPEGMSLPAPAVALGA